MDSELNKALRKIIEDTIGDMVAEELKARFEPLQRQLDLLQKSNDQIAEQIREDRKDINQIKIDQARGNTQNKVIIDNQNTQSDELIKAVKEEAQQIPKNVEKSVEKLFDTKPFLKRLKDKFNGSSK